MNEVAPPITIKTDSVGLFLLMMLLAGVLMCGLVLFAWVRARRGTASPRPVSARLVPSFSRFSRFVFLREFAWLAVPIVVITSFGMTADPRAFLSGWGLPTRTVAPLSSPPQSIAVQVETDQIPASTVSARNSSARPAWMDKPRMVEGDSEQIVLTSQQYSTREEAEQELRSATVKLVEEDLRRLQSGPFRPASWRPAVEDVIEHAVKERYDDVAERDFGSFTHPMHRVSWQVELSPRVRTEFMPAWRRALISFRILFVASVASLCAMVVSSGVMYFRLDSLTQGHSRGGLTLLACTLVAVWWALVAAAFSQGHWW